MYLSPGSLNAAGFVIKAGSDGRILQLPVTTINSIIRELGLSQVDFVKMDIEGAERNALAGAVVTIKEFRPRMTIPVCRLAADPIVIPETIRSGYPQECKTCQVERRIRPQVYFCN